MEVRRFERGCRGESPDESCSDEHGEIDSILVGSKERFVFHDLPFYRTLRSLVRSKGRARRSQAIRRSVSNPRIRFVSYRCLARTLKKRDPFERNVFSTSSCVSSTTSFTRKRGAPSSRSVCFRPSSPASSFFSGSHPKLVKKKGSVQGTFVPMIEKKKEEEGFPDGSETKKKKKIPWLDR